jgi:hypothetical protein
MSRITRSKRIPVASAALLALLACLLLAACGGSSGSSSSTASTNASATSSTSGKGQPAGRKRFTALRECLAKNGITLPKRTPGQAGGGGFLGGAAGGGPQLPKGVTRAQYEAAVKKCGGAGGRFGPGATGTQRFKSPAFTQALTKFAACMREKGVKLPTPNTSGKGPIFNTSGLNPASAAFKAAQAKCSSALRGAFRAQPGRAGAPPSAG